MRIPVTNTYNFNEQRHGLRSWCVSLFLLLITQVAQAADWYAKDNCFGGHDPSIVRYEDGYALMVTNNMLTLYTSEDAINWNTLGRTLSSIPNWLKIVTNNQTEDIWAPDLNYFGNQFRVYYTG